MDNTPLQKQHYWSLLSEIRWWPSDSTHKGSVMTPPRGSTYHTNWSDSLSWRTGSIFTQHIHTLLCFCPYSTSTNLFDIQSGEKQAAWQFHWLSRILAYFVTHIYKRLYHNCSTWQQRNTFISTFFFKCHRHNRRHQVTVCLRTFPWADFSTIPRTRSLTLCISITLSWHL